MNTTAMTQKAKEHILMGIIIFIDLIVIILGPIIFS